MDMLPWKLTTLAGNHSDFASQRSAHHLCEEHFYYATWDGNFEICSSQWKDIFFLVICILYIDIYVDIDMFMSEIDGHIIDLLRESFFLVSDIGWCRETEW